MPRALSQVERAFWLLDRSTSFNGVNTSFLRGPIGVEELRRALEWVQARHELLRVAIVDDAFVPLDAPPPLRVVPRAGDDTWQACEREEINGRYETGELLWRAVWVQGDGRGELLISHQHVICDAQSAVLMAREIVGALGLIVEGKEPPPPAPLQMKPAMTDLLGAGLGEKILAMNAFFFRNLVFHGLRPAKKLATTAPFAERRLGIAHLDLDEPQTSALALRAKAEETSVQGALCAAMLLAAADELALARPQWLGCFSAVSLHERLGIREDMGLYISQLTTYHKVARGTALWPLAREVKRDLGRALKLREQLVTIPMIGMFIPRGADPAPRFAKKFDLASPATLGLSNIGRVELPRAVGSVSLERFHLAVGPSVVAPLAACAATVHGQLHLSLVYVEPLYARARAEALTARTREILSAEG
jgi:hypothetical protein